MPFKDHIFQAPNCEEGDLTIFDGNKEAGTVLKTLCSHGEGEQFPIEVTSLGNSMTVLWKNRAGKNGAGKLKATWNEKEGESKEDKTDYFSPFFAI